MPRAPPLKKILLVEDNADTLRILSRLLKGWGYEVGSADSVRKGLELSAGEPFDMVISDLGLPDGSGLDLMREVKKLHGVPGIALSGYGAEEDIRQSRAAGFEEHLIKPVSLDTLRAAVYRVASKAA
jgi:CheY-like chemotaxis protein